MSLPRIWNPVVFEQEEVCVEVEEDWDGKLKLSGGDCQWLGVSGTSVVCIDLFGGCTLVQANRSVEEVIAGCVIVVATCVVREVVFEQRARQFFGKKINFIQEQNLIEFVK